MRLGACLLLVVALAGCGGGGDGSAGATEEEDVLAVARAHLGEPDAERVSEEATVDGDRATVTITFENLRDDSVRDARHIVTLRREDGEWRVVGDEVAYRCHEGRGHQDFSPQLCL